MIGQLIARAGATAATTTTALLHEAVSRVASVTVHVREVAPTGNNEPDGGVHETVIGGVPPTTTGLKLTAAGLPW